MVTRVEFLFYPKSEKIEHTQNGCVLQCEGYKMDVYLYMWLMTGGCNKVDQRAQRRRH